MTTRKSFLYSQAHPLVAELEAKLTPCVLNLDHPGNSLDADFLEPYADYFMDLVWSRKPDSIPARVSAEVSQELKSIVRSWFRKFQDAPDSLNRSELDDVAGIFGGYASFLRDGPL